MIFLLLFRLRFSSYLLIVYSSVEYSTFSSLFFFLLMILNSSYVSYYDVVLCFVLDLLSLLLLPLFLNFYPSPTSSCFLASLRVCLHAGVRAHSPIFECMRVCVNMCVCCLNDEMRAYARADCISKKSMNWCD